MQRAEFSQRKGHVKPCAICLRPGYDHHPGVDRSPPAGADGFYGGITSGGGLVWRARPSWWSRPGEAVDPMGGILRSVTSRMPLP